MSKYYGNGVSISGVGLKTEDKSFDLVIFQEGKPLVDRELILQQEIQSEKIRQNIANKVPSGWLSFKNSPLNSKYKNTGVLCAYSETEEIYHYLQLGNVTDPFNEFLMEKAVVNGWEIRVGGNKSDISGNLIELGDPPGSIGTGALQFVFLEIWLQILNSSDGTGLESGTGIYPYGNTEWGGVTFDTNQIEHPTYGAETTRRVQLQYKFRILTQNSTISINSQSDPFTIFNALGQAGSGVDFDLFVNQESNLNDSGLWRSGDGDPLNTLNTIDGYTYAIPIALVQRLNPNQYSVDTNPQGFIGYRPDGIVTSIYNTGIVDLRHKISYESFNYKIEAETTKDLLFRNSLGTFFENGSGVGDPLNVYGTRLLHVDGLSSGYPADRTGIDDFNAPDGIRRNWKRKSSGQKIGGVFTKGVSSSIYGSTIVYDSGANTITINAPVIPSGTLVSTFTPVCNWIMNSVDSLALGSYQKTVDFTGAWAGLGTAIATVTFDIGDFEYTNVNNTEFYVYAELQYPFSDPEIPLYSYEDVIEVVDITGINDSRPYAFGFEDNGVARLDVYRGTSLFVNPPSTDTTVIDYPSYDAYPWDNVKTNITGNLTLQDIPRHSRPCVRQFAIESIPAGAVVTIPITVDTYTITSIMGVTDLSGTPLAVDHVLGATGYVRGATDWTITLTAVPGANVIVYANTDAPGIMLNQNEGGISETYRVNTLTGTYITNINNYVHFTAESPGLDMPGTLDLYGTYTPKAYFNGVYSHFIIRTFLGVTQQIQVFENNSTDEFSLNGIYGVMQFAARGNGNGTLDGELDPTATYEVPYLEKYPLDSNNTPAIFNVRNIYQGSEPQSNINDYQIVKCRLETLVSAYSGVKSEFLVENNGLYPSNIIPIVLDTTTWGVYTFNDFPVDPYDALPSNDILLNGTLLGQYPELLLKYSSVSGKRTEYFYAQPFKEGMVVNLNSVLDPDTDPEYGKYVFGCLIGVANGGNIFYWVAPNFMGCGTGGKLWLNFLSQIKQSDIIEFNPNPDDFTGMPWYEPRVFIPYGRPIEKLHAAII